MQKIIMAAVIMLLASCTSRTADKESKKTDSTTIETTKEDKSQEEKDKSPEKELSLNQGKKWKLDDITRTNVAAIKKLLDDKSGQDPKALAVEIRKGTDKMVKECRMQGADHEALHTWLEGFLKDVGELENAKAGEAAEDVKELREGIDKFYQYFE